MPDFDRLPRRVARPWSTVGELIRGRKEPLEVADHMERAIAATLRASECGPLLERLALAARDARLAGSPELMEITIAALAPGAMGDARQAFVDAARVLGAAPMSPEWALNPGDVLKELVSEGIRRLPWKLCLGPLEPELVPVPFSSSGELIGYANYCLALVRVGALTTSLLRPGRSGRIIAPRRRRLRRSTEEMLFAPIQ